MGWNLCFALDIDMRNSRLSLFFSVLILTCIGIVMVYSASSLFALERFGDGEFFLKRHILFFIVGLILMFFVMSIDYVKLRKWTKPLLFLTILLLLLVLIPGIGHEIRGARRWFVIGPFSFQPSEFAKITLILYLAEVLSRKQPKINSFSEGFLPPMLILGLCTGLIIIGPDLGTSVIIIFIASIMFYVAGIRMVHIVPMVIGSIPVVIAFIIHKAYRIERVLTFINPWRDPLGVGYQPIQSLIAIGSGGFFGKGLGDSYQKLYFLPEAHTDFIFSIIAEELGFIGAAVILFLYLSVLFHSARIAFKSNDLFGHLIVIGIISKLAIEIGINIAVSLALLPTKGLVLPFLSYGGSALVCNLVLIGIVLNVGKDIKNRLV
ncbi:putative lipid II flippase FtsW [bacterium Unc6]|nr:putative lipid II flippase FtsW [bacterium Unc6]